MKSIKIKRQVFSMEDFESGLMLAGYIPPVSISELKEREELEEYEKVLNKERSSVFFKRVVLAAEIGSQLYEERTFGRVKFQKMLYLCEHAAEMDLQERYTKQAAGPFDNKFMHTIDIEFKKHKLFNVQRLTENNIVRYKYYPLENLDDFRKYYDNYFKQSHTRIQKVIDLFRSQKTDVTEIAATIHACLIELLEQSKDINKTLLVDLFYNWAEQKKRFTENQIVEIWEWMKREGITPIDTIKKV